MKSISVLMVFCENDDAKYLEECLDSLSNQTLRPNEVVIIQNGPIKDFNLERLTNNFLAYFPVVIKYLNLNYGLAYALNFGLKYCSYELIARMDPDDISLPERLEKQANFMNDNSHLAASSAWIEEFSNDLQYSKGIRYTPVGEITFLNKYAKLRSPLNHVPSILRKSIIEKVGGYPDFKKGQDYALWSLLLMNGYKLANLDMVLAHIRSSSEKTDRRGFTRLYSEIPLLFYQYKIGFLNIFELIYSLFIRISIRIIPYNLRKKVFAMLRKYK